MSRRLVMAMLDLMTDGRRRGKNGYQQEARHKGQDKHLSLQTSHILLLDQRRLQGFPALNSMKCLHDLLFRQQSTLDVFLHHALVINEDADW